MKNNLTTAVVVLLPLAVVGFVVVLLVTNNGQKKPAERKTPAEVFGKPIVKVWSGRCVGVTDGDTVKVLNAENVEVKIRLEGIDAPETKQAFGDKAKRYLSGLVFGRNVQVLETGTDFFKRTLAVLMIGETNVNESMICDRFAWHFKRYSDDQKLHWQEWEARSNKRGLWSDPEPIAPWDWRKRK